VATKKVISAFDYAAGRVVESDMPARLVDRRVLGDEQIAAVVDAVLAVERYYRYPVDVEWVLDKYRRPGEPACIVQARPVTLTSAGTNPMPTTWDPAAIATSYAFKR
jgi:pyruvate, water dikinase